MSPKPSTPALDARPGPRHYLLLLAITCAAIAVHGYHPYVEDAEIYVPGIKQALNPALYPYNQGFFASHARMTLFPNLVAATVRITHLPFDGMLLAWHFLSIFLLLLGCWRLSATLFHDARARWGSVALVASLLTIPVAGTALYLLDQYFNTRSLSTPAVLFLVLNTLERKFLKAGLWAVFTAMIHPLMVGFGVSYAVLLLWFSTPRSSFAGWAGWVPAAAVLFPLGLFPPVTQAYRDVLNSHEYFFLLRWQWYEWVGIFAPLALLAWFGRIARRRNRWPLRAVCHALICFTLLFFAAGLAITVPQRWANLAELQPMRALHLVYVLFFLVAGGLLGEFVLRKEAWRWMVLLAPLCTGMYYAQRQLFPSTPHLELPGRAPGNAWVEGFLWIRQHTPVDAYFALDPNHMEAAGEDQHGFRAIAERSMLADNIKDSGAVTMFPALAQSWREQVDAERGWEHFHQSDFERLKQRFGVNWVVVGEGGAEGMNCPYRNRALTVCEVD